MKNSEFLVEQVIKFFLKLQLCAVCALCLWPNEADASASLKVSGDLVDSEQYEGVLFRPSAELTWKAGTEDKLWQSGLQLVVQSNKHSQSPLPQDYAATKVVISQAAVGRFDERYRARIGRLELQPAAVSLNEAAKQFMRNSVSIDGLELVSVNKTLDFGAFIGSRQSLGAESSARFEHMQVGLIYRYQRQKLGFYPETNSAGNWVDTGKVSDLHEAELTLKVPGKVFVSESVLQFTREGPYSNATVLDSDAQETAIGEKDSNLPFEANDYRASTQFKFKVYENAESYSDWLIFSLSSSAAPRYHSGTADDKTFRQGSGTQLRFASGYEIESQNFSAQIMLYGNYASDAQYRFFTQRNAAGEPKLSRGKLGLAMATAFNF